MPLPGRAPGPLLTSTDPLPPALDTARLVEANEQALLAATELARVRTAALWDKRDYAAILPELLGMGDAIHGFFDKVMVNVEDAAMRQNRLRLLADVRELFLRGWDLSKAVVEGDKN